MEYFFDKETDIETGIEKEGKITYECKDSDSL